MSNRYDLFSDQDLQAFADGEIDGERLEALAETLVSNPAFLSRTWQLTAVNETLAERRREIYASDPELAEFIEDLLAPTPHLRTVRKTNQSS